MGMEWNRRLLWAGPIAVLVFVVILAVMYGLVGSESSLGIETREKPEATPAARIRPQPDNRADARKGQPEKGGRLVQHGQFPAGIGNGNIRLINTPTYPMGIGNGNIRLINTPTYPMGIGGGQIKLINQNKPGGPYLGLSLQEVNQAVARELKLAQGSGVYVNGVVSLSPAQKAGVQKGDVILKCAHKAINNPEDVVRILAVKKAGDVIKLVLNRNGSKQSLHVKLANAPMGLQVGAIQNPVWMGADIQDIDAVMKIKFNLPDNRGVIVSHVAQNSPAQEAGLRTADVIRRFEGTRIRDVKQLQDLILGSRPGKNVRLTILRDGRHATVQLTMGRKTPRRNPRVPFLGPAEVAIEGSWIGMDVTELSAADAADLGLPGGTKGILVNDVESPPATTVGFQSGDLIVAVNGQPTPDMKAFGSATKKQSGAVVDTIRGNRHLLISVPPPGFTPQGTSLKTGRKNKMKQVAMTRPANRRLGILATGPDLNAAVAGNLHAQGYLVIVDPAKKAYAAVGPDNLNPLGDALRHYGVKGLICSDITRATAGKLVSRGVAVYAGVSGSVWDAIGLYESHQLAEIQGF